MFSKEIFGKRLRETRVKAHVTQPELATALGSNKSTISMLESGQRSPSIEYLYALADYFNVSLDYLVGREWPKEE